MAGARANGGDAGWLEASESSLRQMRFPDRRTAGRMLAEALRAYADRPDVVVLGLPRGGVPVAFEVARALAAPLDVFVVRKLGVPGHEELAFGAVASGGVRVLNDEVVGDLGLTPATIEGVAERESRELQRREEAYRGGDSGAQIEGQTVIVVDDGLATGSTMRAAVEGIRARGAAEVVVAVPTAAPEVCAALRRVADDVVCLSTPDWFQAVGFWYDDFRPTTDDEVRELLDRGRDPGAAGDV